MSMSIQIQFSGDVDHLPHKDLAEKIIRSINEAVKAVGGGDYSVGFAQRTDTRRFLGGEPYVIGAGGVTVVASWGVHIDG